MQMTNGKFHRLRLGMSQMTLARLVNLAHWRVVKIEGGAEPRLHEAIALADVLCCDIYTLMTPIEIDRTALHALIVEEARQRNVGVNVRVHNTPLALKGAYQPKTPRAPKEPRDEHDACV